MAALGSGRMAAKATVRIIAHESNEWRESRAWPIYSARHIRRLSTGALPASHLHGVRLVPGNWGSQLVNNGSWLCPLRTHSIRIGTRLCHGEIIVHLFVNTSGFTNNVVPMGSSPVCSCHTPPCFLMAWLVSRQSASVCRLLHLDPPGSPSIYTLPRWAKYYPRN